VGCTGLAVFLRSSWVRRISQFFRCTRLSARRQRGWEPWLAYLAGKTTVWWTIVALSVFTDLLFVPVGLALYAPLKKVHKSAMSVATVFIGQFVVLDLAVTWSHYAALLALSSSYSTATSDISGRATSRPPTMRPPCSNPASLSFMRSALFRSRF
jgi:hypothetical protein